MYLLNIGMYSLLVLSLYTIVSSSDETRSSVDRLFLRSKIEVVQKDPLIGIGAALNTNSSVLIELNKYNCCVCIIYKISFIMNIVKISKIYQSWCLETYNVRFGAGVEALGCEISRQPKQRSNRTRASLEVQRWSVLSLCLPISDKGALKGESRPESETEPHYLSTTYRFCHVMTLSPPTAPHQR